MVYLFSIMYVSPARTYTYKSYVLWTSLRLWETKIFMQVYKIITGLALHSQAAADTIIYLWRHVPETLSTVKFQGIYLCVINGICKPIRSPSTTWDMAPVSGMIKKNQSHLLRMTVHLFFTLILLIIWKYTRPFWNKVCATVLNVYSKKFAILCIDRAEAANPYIESDNAWTGENYWCYARRSNHWGIYH